MQIAIQEDMLPGRSMLEKFENARKLGVQGIEFWGRGLSAKVPAIAEAMLETGIAAATVNHGRQGRLLDPHVVERERALAELRDSIACAVDIGARGVIFVPHFFGPVLPDLTPYKTADELQAELLYTHLRTLSDFADAMGVDLYVEPINRYETHFMNRLEQAASITRKLNHHRVKIVADVFHMAMEEENLAQALHDHADQIGHVHLADSNRRLPGRGTTDFATIASALNTIGFDGWAAFECGSPSDNQQYAAEYMAEFPKCLSMLHNIGF
jgi:sugar phosphate isomerase/epimerase